MFRNIDPGDWDDQSFQKKEAIFFLCAIAAIVGLFLYLI